MSEIKLAAVVVIYNQLFFETETYRTLLSGIDIQLLIYDNSLKAQVVKEDNTIKYIHNPYNPGVSTAYNKAILWANEISATHLLLLDSDSTFSIDAIKNYLQGISNYPTHIILPSLYSNNRKISPFYFSFGKSHYGDNIKCGELNLGKQLAINAGTILPLQQIGSCRFNEELPLDWSDVYFFRKASEKHVKARHISLEIQHGLSEHEKQSLTTSKIRFIHYINGIPIVASNFFEHALMLFWAKLRVLKLCVRFKTIWFLKRFLTSFYAGS
ncbi:MAG: rhamnosyltransferase [Patiriisocius sp.]|jgi:rhamnosyltransferase